MMGEEKMDLKERRNALGLTQEEAANLCGFDGASLASYERGYYGPRPERAKALAALYGCTLEQLYESIQESQSKSKKTSGFTTKILKLMQTASPEKLQEILSILEKS